MHRFVANGKGPSTSSAGGEAREPKATSPNTRTIAKSSVQMGDGRQEGIRDLDSKQSKCSKHSITQRFDKGDNEFDFDDLSTCISISESRKYKRKPSKEEKKYSAAIDNDHSYTFRKPEPASWLFGNEERQQTHKTEVEKVERRQPSQQQGQSPKKTQELDMSPLPNSQPDYNYLADEIVFETFHSNSGLEFQCLWQKGKRFYLDSWETQEWQPFPEEWYGAGSFSQDNLVSDKDSPPDVHNEAIACSSNSLAVTQPADDRAGTIQHPVKGLLKTYMFEEKKNTNYYFDNKTGIWQRLPVNWELLSGYVNNIINQIQEAVPKWTNQTDILAALRASNYDADDCITTYLTWGGAEHCSPPCQTIDISSQMEFKESEVKIREQKKRVASLEKSVNEKDKRYEKEKLLNEKCSKQIRELKERIDFLESEVQTQKQKVLALQNQPKPADKPPKIVKEKVFVEKVNPVTIIATNGAMRRLHKSFNYLQQDVKERCSSIGSSFKEVSDALRLIVANAAANEKRVAELRELYSRQALERKLLHNQLQELRGNIRVCCRVKPAFGSTTSCMKFPSENEVEVPAPSMGTKIYQFDKVFTQESTQEEVFQDAFPLITSCIDGYNVAILAYGQTGSGKTYTMMGPANNPGVNIRAIRELLDLCKKRENVKYQMTISMLEIYNESLHDLLTENSGNNLEIRVQGKKVFVPGLREESVEKIDDLMGIMKRGNKNRSIAETKLNSSSSRSHLLLRLTVAGHDSVSGSKSLGTLTLVDLAGSERVAKSEASGQRLTEAAAINKSLSALGQVFTSLRTNQLHIPYRNSKLTHLLQPSLGGNAKACLYINVSTDEKNLSETLSTLQFGSQARQVQLGKAERNVIR